MKTLKRIIIIIILIIIIGSITAYIDYTRINNNKKPVFSIENYNNKSKIESYIGIFYVINRTCSITNKEQISDSKKISYKIFGKEIKLNSNILKTPELLKINTKEDKKCTESKLILANKDIKIYTYCLDSIKIISYDKEYTLEEYLKNNSYKKIINALTFDGTTVDKHSLELIDNKNISNNGIKAIQCSINNNTDIYLGPNNMTYQEDFCTNKDDDFDFMWEIVDKHDKNFKCEKEAEKEVLFEDLENRYEFDCLKSDLIFVTTPALRGKEETNIPIKEALDNGLVTIQEAIKRGLKVNTINKEEEAKKQNTEK